MISELLNAAHAWLCGPLTDPVFGLKIYWIGRAGKILQFIGGIAVIAEIVGAERLRFIGRKLKQDAIKSAMTHRVRDVISWVWLLWSAYFEAEGYKARFISELKQIGINGTAVFSMISAIGGAVYVLFFAKFDNWFQRWIFIAVAFVFFGLFVGPLIVVLIVACNNCLRLAFGFMLEPIAAALDSKSPETTIKIWALLFVVLGFALDMYAS